MRRFHRDEQAQAIVLIAIVTSVLLLGVGLAIDTGQLYAGRRAAQTAADSAAWAGAVVIHTATSATAFTAATRTAAESAAVADALRNGYTITAAADVNTPPLTGTFRQDPGFVEVILTTNVQTTFFPGPRPVTVRAVAGATRSGSGNAIHILNPGNVAAVLDLVGAGRLDVTGGDVRVNSTNAASIRIASGAITTGTSATRVAGTPGTSAGDAGQVTPAVIPSQAAQADPFLRLPGPETTALWGAAYGATPAVLTEQGPGVDRNSNNAPLFPGIYSGGIRIRGTSNVTMNPGIYILRGAGLDNGFLVEGSAQVNMASATAGVFIFNTYSDFPTTPGTTNCGRLDINTTGSVTLRPATAGSYAGIVFYNDRQCLYADVARIRGTGARNITGTIYIPTTELQVSNLVTLNLSGQIVAFEFEGNATDLNLTFAPVTSAGSRVPAVVE